MGSRERHPSAHAVSGRGREADAVSPHGSRPTRTWIACSFILSSLARGKRLRALRGPPRAGTRGLRIKIDTSGRHSDRPDVDDSHQQDLLSRSPLAADLRRSLKSGVDHRPSWAAGAALSPAASLAPAAAAPASTEVGLETRTGPFQERIEAEHRFRTVCRALLAPGLLPGPARPDEPDASSLAGRVAVARWAARAMGMPAVVLERAVAEALDANRQLLATYER